MKLPTTEVILIMAVAFFIAAQRSVPVSLLVCVPETENGEKAVVSVLVKV